MDVRIQGILESLLANVDVLNSELLRLGKTEQFSPTAQSFQLIEQIRGICTCTLQNLRTVERGVWLRSQAQEKNNEGEIIAFQENSRG